MLGAEETVTLYLRLPGGGWRPVVFHGVSWRWESAREPGEHGARRLKSARVRIPETAAPLPFRMPGEWKEEDAGWTLREGDLLARGEPGELCSAGELDARGIQWCVLRGWRDNRTGGIPHWKLEGF